MTSLQTTPLATTGIQNYSISSELQLEKKAPKSSILKNKGQVSFKQNPSQVQIQMNISTEARKRKTKLSFNSPVSKTISVENWKEYNTDMANKEEELCICAIF